MGGTSRFENMFRRTSRVVHHRVFHAYGAVNRLGTRGIRSPWLIFRSVVRVLATMVYQDERHHCVCRSISLRGVFPSSLVEYEAAEYYIRMHSKVAVCINQLFCVLFGGFVQHNSTLQDGEAKRQKGPDGCLCQSVYLC